MGRHAFARATSALLMQSVYCFAADPSPAVIDILEKVEARGATVDDLTCKVIYRVDDHISDDVTRRYGTIRFKKKTPNPIFMVTFDKLVEDGEIHLQKQWYLFDGRYLFEALQRTKSIIRRDLAPPGTQIDLFSIEKAPFPIPFGQKKADILQHFDVALAPADKAALPNVDHLICKPKSTSRLAKDYDLIEFFISRDLYLPVRIVMTTNPPDKVITADFPDLSEDSINTRLEDSSFKLPPETRRYSVANE